ncbi:porin family protein [Vibrio sinaloensis]|uniref:porin family protein n=1 Tax=Photobacterium sp. (strain ATCC 43367) TaxID=379097 RepID=UPI00206C134F|nr:porin family protein [Vibrio sinaloensis]UPQ88826.1 porin family protein [Vibrio sinaloensis]
MKRITLLSLAITLPTIHPAAGTELYLTPWFGYSVGGSVEDQNQNEFDLKGSQTFAVSIESQFDTGRVGLFYAGLSTDIEQLNSGVKLHYLHFQSSVYYPVQDTFSSYLGIGVGGSYIDANWVGNELGFSASVFGGFEYQINDALAVNSQLRWLGTVVDNDTSGVCNLPTNGQDSCIVKFKTDWMNQFSANIGLTLRF